MFAPESTYDIGGRFEQPISEGWSFTTRVEYRWQDKFYFDPSANGVNTQPAYGLLDASVGLLSRDGRIAIDLWGKNLDDELYRTHVIPFLGDRFAVYGWRGSV